MPGTKFRMNWKESVALKSTV